MGKLKVMKVKTDKLKLLAKDNPIKKVKKVKVKKENVKEILKDRIVIEHKPKVNVDLKLVKLAIEGLFKLTNEQSKKLFDEEYPILLQITLIKIPNCPNRIIRLPLKHSLLTDTSEVCLIVSDLEKGRKVDYNPTIEYYEDLLRTNKINNINRIIPMNCIKTEYDQYELKKRLVMQYDHFLADGRITRHLTHLLGKVFYQKRKKPTPIHFGRPDLKRNIDNALKTIQMRIHSEGTTYITQIGHSKMKNSQIVDNFNSVCEALQEQIPGNWENIRCLSVKTHLSISIPVYMSLKNCNEIQTPRVKAKRPKMFIDVTGELSTKSNSEVKVTASGDIIVEKIKKIKQPEKEEDSDDE